MVDRWTLPMWRRSLPCACLLCGAETTAGPVCRGCLADLPRIPSACPRCGLPLPVKALCGECALALPPLDQTVVPLEFSGAARALVHALKFRGYLPLAGTLGEILAAEVQRRGGAKLDSIMAVPLHGQRLRGRGFNQALEIARVVGAELGVQVVSSVAHRTRRTAAQTDLGGVRARQQNVAGAFRVEAEAVRGRRLAVVDDVMTTGSTVYELARALRAAGASGVEAWVCCRATAHSQTARAG